MGFQQQADQTKSQNRISLTSYQESCHAFAPAHCGRANEACRLLSAPNQHNSNWRGTRRHRMRRISCRTLCLPKSLLLPPKLWETYWPPSHWYTVHPSSLTKKKNRIKLDDLLDFLLLFCVRLTFVSIIVWQTSSTVAVVYPPLLILQSPSSAVCLSQPSRAVDCFMALKSHWMIDMGSRFN